MENDSVIWLELIVAVIIAFLSAGAGGWVGYVLARVRDDRLRTVDFALHILSEEFSGKRLRFLDVLGKLTDQELETASNPKVDEFAIFRRDSIEIFNTYELICLLKSKGDLDEKIFSTQLLPIMAADYAAADTFFEKMEEFQKANGGDLRRPFYEKIALCAPRPE